MYKLYVLGVMAAGVAFASADITRVEVMYVNGFTYQDPLVDADGVALTAGGPANDDGAIFQIGYFSGVSHLLAPSSFGEAEWSQFTPLTGLGSPNAARHPTTIGGIDSRASGPFGFLFYPSPVAIELDTEIDEGIPLGGVYRLGVRFFNGTTLESSSGYNIVTSSDLRWIMKDPEPSPTGAAVLNMDEHELVWASGEEFAFQTSLPMVPDGSFGQFVADSGLGAGPDSQPVPDQSGSGGNPDRDIHSNLLEYALTEDPNTGASPDAGGFSVDLVDQASGRIDVKFSRPHGVLDLIYTIQTKNTLTGVWTDFISIAAGEEPAASFLVTPNGDATDSVVYPDIANDVLSGLSTELGFVRLQVALDADQNGVPDTLPSDGSPVVDQTKTFGWQCIQLNTAQTASYSHPFSNAPVFSGTVDYVQGTAVNVATSSNNFDLAGLIGGNGSHYLQITSGPLEGQRFDIASAAVLSLSLVNDPDIFTDTDGISSLNTSSGMPAGADIAGHSFVVVPHLTIDQLFDKNAAFAGLASGIPSKAAKLFFYNNRSDTPGLESLLLVDLGNEQRWIRSNDFQQLADQGGTPVDRCAGSYIHPGLGPVTNQFALGMVADHALAAAFNSGYNLAGSPFPMDQTPTGPDGRAMTVANGFAGGINPTQASEILFWTGDFATDRSATYIQGYDSYMQLDGGGMQRWIDVSDQNLDDLGDSLLLESHRAPTIKIPSGTRIEPHVYPAPSQP